jgi:cleavage and polyadenylation specificity factor subunit 2
VVSLGRALCLDLYKSAALASSIIPHSDLTESAYSFPSLWNRRDLNILRQPPSSEEIAGYFTLIHQLKYSQSHRPTASSFSPPLNGLTITAHSAGHTLGGTIWHIQHGLESLVYAVDWNQAREHVLSGAAWLGAGGAEVVDSLRRPTALICSSRASQRVALEGGRSKRDELLLRHIRETIAKGGTALVPTDSSARVLELVYLLENAWASERGKDDDIASLRRAGLYLASAGGGATIRYAKSMLEWMEEGIVREFEAVGSRPAQGTTTAGGQSAGKQNDPHRVPFDFKYLRVVDRKPALSRILGSGSPKVIIASDTSLQWGFSRDIITSIAQDDRNLVVLPERIDRPLNGEETIGSFLWSLYLLKSGASTFNDIDEHQAAIALNAGGAELNFRNVNTELLLGEDLAIYQQFLARQRQLQNTLNADKGTTLETAADAMDDRSSTTSESSEESDAELQGKALNVSAALTQARHKLGLSDAELGIDILIRRKGHHDYDVHGKKGREKSFPVIVSKRNFKKDEFGDAIRPEDYLRAEERDEVDEEVQETDTRKDTAVGQKRKWADVAAQASSSAQKPGNGMAKRRRPSDLDFDGIGSPDALRGAALNGDFELPDANADEEEESGSANVGPQKVVFTEGTLKFGLRIAYVDFCGLHDRRSLQLLIPLIRPRKLILVGGDQQETQALAEECERMLNTGTSAGTESAAEVFTPAVGTTVDASVDTNAWMIRASKPFAKQIHWQTVRGLGVVALTGRMAAIELSEPAEQPLAKKMKKADGKSEDAPQPDTTEGDDAMTAPVIDNVPANMATGTRMVAQYLHVGDLRLAELRKLMQSAGFAAEFRGEGTLVVNGQVAVRKGGTGKLEVEGIIDTPALGGPDPTFYDVRRKVYEGLAIVAGG